MMEPCVLEGGVQSWLLSGAKTFVFDVEISFSIYFYSHTPRCSSVWMTAKVGKHCTRGEEETLFWDLS